MKDDVEDKADDLQVSKNAYEDLHTSLQEHLAQNDELIETYSKVQEDIKEI